MGSLHHFKIQKPFEELEKWNSSTVHFSLGNKKALLREKIHPNLRDSKESFQRQRQSPEHWLRSNVAILCCRKCHITRLMFLVSMCFRTRVARSWGSHSTAGSSGRSLEMRTAISDFTAENSVMTTLEERDHLNHRMKSRQIYLLYKNLT